MLPTVRSVMLTNYVGVARHVGLDPYEMLRRSAINPDSLIDPETRLPAANVVDLLEASARMAQCMSFAVLLAEARSFQSLGPLALLVEHQATVRDMMRVAESHPRHLNDIAEIRITDDDDVTILQVGIYPEYATRQIVEYSVGTGVRILSEATHGRWYPEVVHFRHSAPPDLTIHRRFYQCAVEFEAAFDGLSCASRAADIRNPLADRLMANHAERLLDLVPLPEVSRSIVERTRHAIYLNVHSGLLGIERIGSALDLHPRTLQRMLQKEGHSFGEIVNDVRRELAVRYLSNDVRPIDDVAQLTGYSSQSAFTRWFTTEFGKPPAEWRRAVRNHVNGA